MEVQAERRGAMRHAKHQRRCIRRIQGAGGPGQPRPDAAGRQQVGKVHGVDQRPPHVLDRVAGQAAEERVHRVDGLDPGREAQPLDRLLDLPGCHVESVAAFVHQHHDVRVVAFGDQVAVHLRDRGFRVCDHRSGVLVDAADVRVEHLVEEAADLLLPFLAELVEVIRRLVRIHEDEAGRPAVLAAQFSQCREHARRGLQRKALDGHHLHELAADLGHDAAEYLLAAYDRIQVHRVGRQLHRLVNAGDAVLQPAQKRVMRNRGAILLLHYPPREPGQAQAGRQARFEACAVAAERVDQAVGAGAAARGGHFIVEHQFDEAALRQQRREVGERDDEVAFVHRADAFEQLPALRIDGGGHRVGEVRTRPLGVAGRRPAHRVHVHHPAAAQMGQRLVDAEGDGLALGIGAARVVVALVHPRGDERTVLADDDAIVDHGGVDQQVGKRRRSRAMPGQPVAGANRPDAAEQDRQHGRAKRRDGECEWLDHLNCLAWLLLLRNGVLRAG